MTTAQSTAEANKALATGAIECAIAGSVEGFLDALDPDIVVHEPAHLPYGRDYHGRDDFLSLFGEAGKILDLSTVKTLAAVADDERVVLLMTIKVIATGEEMIVTEHWQVRDGLVHDVRVFWYGLPPS